MIRPKCILLIEDNEIDAFIANTILAKHFNNCEIVRVANGLEAMRFLEVSNPDLIILDLNMPLMNGKEFLERSLQIRHILDIQVAVLSSSNDLTDKETCQKLDAARYFQKPMTNSMGAQLSKLIK
ncbi:response regulator [Fulvivirga sp. M361]|uniref:response regulator n=1 Tax=Fulvivirga sp. M361 TaxID=2594266 RepID=UPI001179C0DA|nr:response regulator [Fulvivirga sp. M361]TRX62090.1 response regulator [Fulvivirga sp. M361]